MKVKFIGKKAMRVGRKEFHPGDVVEVPESMELPKLYFEFLDKPAEDKPKTKTSKKTSK